ncbi:histidine phosphatase family protein [Leucobacter chromiireducens]|uniref:Histidine phosphatase family protein n=1 Tax=Leucobacter chromiireducens subsp. chromiireducens TaxID=660067 RepID=A0ABS1SQ52_9MICO|nr:histidine phosphatase family protein [Leucobacter chromiireducens]MBL3689629.1 histidine phosphatase family protein [Leucobacter chromiireducens subsp. chromiireducens]
MSTSSPPAASIVIVRHGETDWNIGRRIQGRTDIPLNERGRAQAGEIADLLAVSGRWSRVVVSPLGRAVATGQIIAERLGLATPEIDDAVTERDFGPAEGLQVSEVTARWPGLDIPEAEGLVPLAQRGAAAFTRQLREAPGSIVIAHGALIRAALSELSGEPAPRILNGEAWLLSAVPGISGPAVRRLGTPAMQHAL